MIDINQLRENPEGVKGAIKKRGWKVDLAGILDLDKQYRTLLREVEKSRALLNTLSRERVQEKEKIAQIKADKVKLKQQEEKLSLLKKKVDDLIKGIPNYVKEDVPAGRDESSNVVLKSIGEPPKFEFFAKDYLTLSVNHDLIDLERAAKVSGARFYYLKNEAALLSLALVRYGLDIALGEGFVPILPPVMIGKKAMAGMGYLERGGEEETYHFLKDDLYLVGTSEQSIGPMHMNEILEVDKLPLRYVAFSTCFRREAGSYGKDTKGILRAHQFDKLEMFSITTPEKSDEEHKYLLSLQEKFMGGLNLPYRVVQLCAGDLAGPSVCTYDIEAWIPSQGKYRETHSTSNTTDFQSRRLSIKYRRPDGSTELVHMLNGTMVAVNRPLIAILESNQRADGSINLPQALHPYLGGRKRIE